jgi:hypothetical protein
MVAVMTDGAVVLPTIFMGDPGAPTSRDPYSLRGRDAGFRHAYTRLMLARLRRAIRGETGPTCWSRPYEVPRARRVAVLTGGLR